MQVEVNDFSAPLASSELTPLCIGFSFVFIVQEGGDVLLGFCLRY